MKESKIQPKMSVIRAVDEPQLWPKAQEFPWKTRQAGAPACGAWRSPN